MLMGNQNDTGQNLSETSRERNNSTNLYDNLDVDSFLIKYAKNILKLKSWSWFESNESGDLQLSLNYETTERKASFDLPIFSGLEEKFPGFFLEDGGSSSQQLQDYRRWFLDRMFNLIYNPFVMVVVGFGAIADFSKTFFLGEKLTNAVSENTLDTMVGGEWVNVNGEWTIEPDTLTPAPLRKPNNDFTLHDENIHRTNMHFIFLGTAILYFIPPILNYIIKRTSNNVINIFAKVEQDILSNNIRSANNKLTNLGKLNEIWLFRLSGGKNLKWKYYYLDGLIGDKWGQNQRAETSYEIALKLSKTTEERFLILRSLINLNNRLKSRSEFSEYYDRKVKGYISQVSLGSPICIKSSEELKAKLLSCLDSFKNREYKEAYEKFSAIELDCFAENIYVSGVVMYYQLKIALTLVGQLEDVGAIDPESRAITAYRDMLRVQEYIVKYYPYKTEIIRDCINSFRIMITQTQQSNNSDYREGKRITPMADRTEQPVKKISTSEHHHDDNRALLNTSVAKFEAS